MEERKHSMAEGMCNGTHAATYPKGRKLMINGDQEPTLEFIATLHDRVKPQRFTLAFRFTSTTSEPILNKILYF
ncbi:unnamed protein product [Orchesella dallaii]|uniref:Uncharacterized protein n=1 Tax=Orchesella dallaii TaxID=48710 RepID=A0ABP1SAA3_9HEXA